VGVRLPGRRLVDGGALGRENWRRRWGKSPGCHYNRRWVCCQYDWRPEWPTVSEGWFVPTLSEALNLAQQALDSGDHAQAQFVYQRILQAAPDEPNALNGLGVLALHADRLDEAEDYLRRAILASPRDASILGNLSELHRRHGRADEAIACCRQALELAPDWPLLHSNLGVVLKQQEQFEQAVASFSRALELNPNLAEVHYNLANTLVKLDRLDLAEASFRRALELTPSDPETHNNLGNILETQGRLAEAIAHFDTALRHRWDFAEAHRNRSLLRLSLGNYAEGWPEYEWRLRVPGTLVPNFPMPRWQGEPLSGRTILLTVEQGLGDTIQFVRYAPLVKERGGRVVLRCQDAVNALLARSPGIDLIATAEAEPEALDYQCPLLSLPAVLGTTLETIPATIPYLFAQAERVAHWRQKLADVRELKVGIAWQGSPTYGADRYRSIPLEKFAPLAACPGVRLFSLQKGYGHEQLAPLAEQWNIVDLGTSLDEGTGAFVDTAAAMMNLDLVITSDTSIAHVAGALGVPVWVALQFSPSWRWLLERDDSPWYPTMRLFRQSRFGNWEDVFADMAHQLRSKRP
jgi:tetratricopeptide (TPR) repeat protein